MKKIFLFCAALIAAMSINAQTVMTCDDAYNAARALAAGDTLTVEGVVAIVEVSAFVTNGGNGTISNGQQTFYIGQTADEATKTIQVYKGTMPQGAEAVNKGDEVKITGKLMHYVNKSGTTDVAELVNASVEIINKLVVKVDTISDLNVCEIIDEGESLNSGSYSTDFFEVTAVVDSLTYTNESAMQQTFFFKCDNGKTLQAYNAAMQDNTLAALGDTVKVLGKITNYQNRQIEFESPKAWVVGKSNIKIDTITATVSEATTAVMALENNAITKAVYVVTGYVDSIAVAYSEQYGNISFFMTDDMENPTYDFEAFRVKVTAEDAEKIVLGTKVAVTATLKHYYVAATDEDPEIDMAETNAGGSLVILEVPQKEAIDKITSSEKATKLIEAGQVVIIRNGVRYNALGIEVK